MRRSRRECLRAVLLAAAALAAPWSLRQPTPATAWANPEDGPELACSRITDGHERARPKYEPWWVQAFLPTRLWPTSCERDNPLGQAELGRYFRVQAPQDGPRLWVWDPRANRTGYIDAAAVGPVAPPFWAEYLNGLDGRWIDVTLAVPQRAVAMQGDLPVRRALVTAGLRGTTKPGRYQVLRRVENETMDSRTVPGLRDSYYLRNVLFTQYFTDDGAALHYNWWLPPNGFGRPGSHGCLGMRYDDAKFFWDWADLGVPVIIHQ